jgi:glycosyltransferase involved in cell wall biosynthesis
MEDKIMAVPSVSVIIPTYNRASFLPAAIESVLTQSFQNIEVIVVDDGSTDDTKTAVEQYKERIRYIHTDHGGPSHARNVGMKAATGKYIAFLDSDDTYQPYKLETQVSFMEDHPDVGMVYTEMSVLYENGHFDKFNFHNYIYKVKGWHYDDIFSVKGVFVSNATGKPVTYHAGDLFPYALMGTIVPSPTVLFPRNILEVVGFQNEAYKLAEEYEFIVRICKHYKVAFLNIPTYVYHHHSNQTSYFFIKGRLQQKKEILQWIETFSVMLNAVLDWGYKDKEYYKNNKESIDLRLAEIYHVIGLKWLQYGDGKKAMESFKLSYYFNPVNKRKYLIYRCLCFIPGYIFRGLKKLKDLLSLLKKDFHRGAEHGGVDKTEIG